MLTGNRLGSSGPAFAAAPWTSPWLLVRRDIFFRANRYNPSISDGRHLLAHELTHVVQQGASIRRAPRLRLAPANEAYEREADRVAGAVVGGMCGPSASHLGRDQRVQSADARQGPAVHYLTGPRGSPSIQRKVYVGKKRLEQVPGCKDEGVGDRSVSNMTAAIPLPGPKQPTRYSRTADPVREPRSRH